MLFETWAVQGLFVPVQLSSGSMAPTLLGPHFAIRCSACGYRFDCDATPHPLQPSVACPICDWPDNAVDADKFMPGDRVLIEKSAFLWRRPRRWEVVAFRDPNHPRRVCVKRAVGLPGEQVQLRDGDVYADGQIVRKDLAQQRAVRLLVDDADFQPDESEGLPRRWRGERSHSQWGFAGGRFAHPATPPTSDVDWLGYHHWQRRPNRADEVDPVPITDRYAYNATHRRRADQIDAVCDLMLTFRLVKLLGEGELRVRATDGRETFTWQIDAQRRRWRVLRGDETVPGGVGPMPPLDHPVLVEWSLFDDQLLLALDGKVVLSYPYLSGTGGRRPSRMPVAVGVNGPGVELRELRVFRDIYYSPAIGPEQRWGVDSPVFLEADEYFVLGDNNPISADSRTWPTGPAVCDRLLVGKPILVHYPAMRLQWGTWRIHVPDPAEIRYIR